MSDYEQAYLCEYRIDRALQRSIFPAFLQSSSLRTGGAAQPRCPVTRQRLRLGAVRWQNGSTVTRALVPCPHLRARYGDWRLFSDRRRGRSADLDENRLQFFLFSALQAAEQQDEFS